MRDFYDFYRPTTVAPGAFVQMPERVSIMDTIAAAEKRKKEEMAAQIQEMQLEQAQKAMEYAKALSAEFSNKSVDPDMRDSIMANTALQYGQLDDAFAAQDRQSKREEMKAREEQKRQEDALQQMAKFLGFDDAQKASAYRSAAMQAYPGLNLPEPTGALFPGKPDDKPERAGTMDIVRLDPAGNPIGKQKNVPAALALQLIQSKQALPFQEEDPLMALIGGGGASMPSPSSTPAPALKPPPGAAVVSVKKR